jgi:hypothetical protein
MAIHTKLAPRAEDDGDKLQVVAAAALDLTAMGCLIERALHEERSQQFAEAGLRPFLPYTTTPTLATPARRPDKELRHRRSVVHDCRFGSFG